MKSIEKIIKSNKVQRVGRGSGSKRGKTSKRGYNGQKSRSGYRYPIKFEGGQFPFMQRINKRGFFKIKHTLTLKLSLVKELDVLDRKSLKAHNLISNRFAMNTKRKIKIINDLNITKEFKYIEENILLSKSITNTI